MVSSKCCWEEKTVKLELHIVLPVLDVCILNSSSHLLQKQMLFLDQRGGQVSEAGPILEPHSLWSHDWQEEAHRQRKTERSPGTPSLAMSSALKMHLLCFSPLHLRVQKGSFSRKKGKLSCYILPALPLDGRYPLIMTPLAHQKETYTRRKGRHHSKSWVQTFG